MFSKIIALIFATSVAAQQPLFQILAPGPDIWWVAGNQDNLAWTPCSGNTDGVMGLNFVVQNQNQSILSGNLTILGNQPIFDCSHSFTPTNLPVATGYTMYLTNASDLTQILATTTFEVKDINNGGYPTITNEPITIGSSSTAGGSSTGSANAASQTNSTNGGKNGASSLMINGVGATFGVVSAVLAGLLL